MNTHALIAQLTEQEKAEFKTFLLSNNSLGTEIAQSAPNKHSCPCCQHKEFIKVGKTRNVQRYKCKSCGKTFGLNTNIVVHNTHTHKPLAT